MKTFLGLIYMIAAYWAVGVVLYGNKTLIYTSYFPIFMKKLILSLILGWLFIPIALIKIFLLR